MFTRDRIPMPQCVMQWNCTQYLFCATCVYVYMVSRIVGTGYGKNSVYHRVETTVNKIYTFRIVGKSFLWPRFIENVQCLRSTGCLQWFFMYIMWMQSIRIEYVQSDSLIMCVPIIKKTINIVTRVNKSKLFVNKNQSARYTCALCSIYRCKQS